LKKEEKVLEAGEIGEDRVAQSILIVTLQPAIAWEF